MGESTCQDGKKYDLTFDPSFKLSAKSWIDRRTGSVPQKGGKLRGIDLRSKIGQNRRDVVDSTGRLRIAQQVEGRQLHC